MNKSERNRVAQKIRNSGKGKISLLMKTIIIAYIVGFMLSLAVIHHNIVSAVDDDGQPFIYQQE